MEISSDNFTKAFNPPLCNKCGGEMLPGHYLSSYYTRDENGNVNQRLEGHLFCSNPFMSDLEIFID